MADNSVWLMKADQELPGDAELDFKPLSAQEAKVWRQKHGWSFVSIRQIVVLQALVGAALYAICWAFYGISPIAWSVAYGAFVVVLPAAVFALGVMRVSGVSGLGRFLVWELIKLVLSVVLLLAAPRLIADVNWLALLLAMIVTVKTYWVALLVLPRCKKPII